MSTVVEGVIYAVDQRRGQVAVRVLGLTPKVIRFHTDDEWEFGERVLVTISKGEAPTEDFILEGYSID